MISSNENQDNINSNMISWGTSMVTNLVSGVTQPIGVGGEPGDGEDKKPGELHFYCQIWVLLGLASCEYIITVFLVLCKFVT